MTYPIYFVDVGENRVSDNQNSATKVGRGGEQI